MGRPRKNFGQEKQEEPVQESQESEPSKDEEQNKPILTVKVVSIGEYLEKARAIYGTDEIWNKAVELLYSENKVIAVLDKKGEQRFVCEL